ncbi:MAG: O-antigen ligase [Candidatus Pedobacter colombiensis]|uniref:O-antigen ligase n=1 Tax=Candidatus Pedobacter colombiensis TaxID=3121371 RepID=A0AAJ5W9W8_9SPHI|nr:O-antigen polymerase [Pedobacter sp.]WEK19679.1 MAG: O-antigen ligase [Pedobacter sp.]
MGRKGYFSNFKIDLANPTIIYTLLWIFSFILYSLEFTNNIIGLNEKTIVLISGSVLSIWMIYLYMSIQGLFGSNVVSNLKMPFPQKNPASKIDYFKNIIRILTTIWLIFTFFEIVYFKGIPLISVVILGQYDLDYKAFGLPTVHGFLNACYLTIVSSYAILYYSEKRRKYLLYIVVFLLWPVLLMSRALILWALIEVFCIYLIFFKLNLTRILKTVGYVFAFIYIFGFIGDNRGEVSETKFTDNFIKDEYKDVSDYIPTGFVWVYLYLTTPINNIVWNIDKVEPKYNLRYTTASLIPSVIRDRIYVQEDEKYSVELYDEAFNVSSYFANYLKDFGIYGALIIGGIIQVIILRFFFSARQFEIGSMLAFSCLFYALALCVFTDFFFSLVTVFQVLLGLFINYLLYSKTKKKIYAQK